MIFPPRIAARAWAIVLLVAIAFLGWTASERARRVIRVTNTDREAATVDPSSPTGYADHKRWLIVPEHNNRSYQWIAETQEMLARHGWRVRQVESENAPRGREVHAASPYRWWLAFLAWADHVVSGQPLGLGVERAALWADPLLHLLLVLGAGLFAARHFGSLAAALLAAGLVTIFPLGAAFLPGVPDDRGLACACALASVLPLMVRAKDDQQSQRLFLLAGIAGGVGLWISATSQVPILLGLTLGGIPAAWLGTRRPSANPGEPAQSLPWRTWAVAGATTSLLGYLIEYFPAHMELRLQVNHPLYGVAWLGCGEVLAQVESLGRRGRSFRDVRAAVRLVLALAAVSSLPVTLRLTATPSLLAGDPYASRLDWLPNAVVAQNLATWFARDGLTGTFAATCLPLLLLVPATWLLFRRATDTGTRTALALGLGPTMVCVILAGAQLSRWNGCDAMLLALLVAMTAAGSFPNRWVWPGFVALVLLPGLLHLLPPRARGPEIEFTRLEVEGLLERGLAHWLADRAPAGGAVVLLPPDRTVSWCFHGGLRGIGTANWENRDGLAATVRIVTATSADEAQALINQRGITHLVLPSWDTDLDQFARWSLPNPEDGFIMALHHWALPPWLRPLPYNLPVVAGFEGQSVVVLAVTDDTNRPAAISRLAEYFLETNQPDLAASTIPALQRFPTDLGVLVALAQVEKARGNGEGYDKALAALLTSLDNGTDRTLAWDRRVSLAVTLAQGDRTDLAREQVQRCLEKLDATRLQSLTTGAQFRLLLLAKAFGLPFPDARLQETAKKLLPPELRARL
ncbi:MAG TPA: hypothetical protein VG734_02210 [Lacunisphaera sp.]|nr:hypothetical protein [Lacunisphaera sp.]